MRVIPGSHKLDLIPSKDPGASALRNEQVDLSKTVDVSLQPGSEPNRSDKHRRAFICSFMGAKSKQIKDQGRCRYFLVNGRIYPGCVKTYGD